MSLRIKESSRLLAKQLCLFIFAHPSLFSAAEIPLLAGKQRKTVNIFLLLPLLQITGRCRPVQHLSICAIICVLFVLYI